MTNQHHGRLEQVDSALKRLEHRGPDGLGVTTVDNVTLGHTRLAIVDLTAGGSQPMTRGEYRVAFNGEIYNYMEVRSELKSLGAEFSSESDTEVLLAAYAQWGRDCVKHFDGMWAFALIDLNRRILFCSRDRFGEKPFYFHTETGLFRFASEPSALGALGVRLRANLTSVKEFVAVDLQTDTSSSFYEGVHSLPPATNLVVSLDTAEYTTEVYYRPGTLGLFDEIDGLDTAVDLLGHELRTSVVRRLRTDVPVGMLLSGGIDSTLLASIAAPLYLERAGRPLTALTSVTGDTSNDEGSKAQATAKALGMRWIEVDGRATPTRTAIRESARIQQRPLRSASVVAGTRVMARAHEEGLKVLIDGQGADESWLGYPRYAVSVSRALPMSQRLSHLWKSGTNSGIRWDHWLALMSYFSLPSLAAARNRYRLSLAGVPVKYSWVRETFGDTISSVRGSLRDVQAHELTGPHLNELLDYEDRNSMAFSIESRLPFLSYRLVELALSCSAAVIMHDGWSKWPVRETLARTGLSERAWAKGKIGFESSPDAFDPTDPEVVALIKESRILNELMEKGGRWTNLPERFVWRLYAVALWEDTCEVLS